MLRWLSVIVMRKKLGESNVECKCSSFAGGDDFVILGYPQYSFLDKDLQGHSLVRVVNLAPSSMFMLTHYLSITSGCD